MVLAAVEKLSISLTYLTDKETRIPARVPAAHPSIENTEWIY